MRLWRLVSPRHAPGLDGEGARRFGGRWNSPGRAVVYASGSLALAALEVLVHIPPPLRTRASFPDLTAVELDLDDALVAPPPARPDPARCRVLGDDWLRAGRSLAWQVPSAVIPLETNILINPAHPEAAALRLIRQVPFVFGDRLGSEIQA